MRRTRATSLVMALFFVAAIGVVVWLNYTRPRILVLHSYSEDYIWTREVNVGLERIFADQNWLLLRYHYMKTKKFKDKEAHRRAGIAAGNAVEKFRPDVLIAIDDYAQKLVAVHFLSDPEMNIVFAGVNGSIEPYGYDTAKNVTGILERKQVKALQEVILMLAADVGLSGSGNAVRTLYLSDSALSGYRDSEYINAFDWQPIDHQGALHVDDFDAWMDVVGKAESMTDFLLVSGYRKLPRSQADPTFVPPDEIMAWTEEHSAIPVLGMNFFNTGDGAMLSVGVSPYEQGEVAASMALEIITEGKSPAEIPIRISKQYVISLRDSMVKKRNLSVPDIFEAFARATNNYYE